MLSRYDSLTVGDVFCDSTEQSRTAVTNVQEQPQRVAVFDMHFSIRTERHYFVAPDIKTLL
jgi:hypothetical protein